jgi:serine protease Do
LVVDVLQEVRTRYVRELTPDEQRRLVESMVNGGLEKLDPHSTFINPEEYKQFARQTKGVFGGVGMSLGFDPQKGNALTVVSPIVGTPAHDAGVLAGDIILKFDGKAIEKSSDLPRLVGNIKPGTRSTVTVFRRGAQRELTVTVAELEAEAPKRRPTANEPKPPSAGPAQTMGLGVAELTEAQKKELKLRGGVRVEASEGAAARAGGREGDVIVAVGNVEVNNLRDFEQAINRADKTKPVLVQLRRGELAQFVLIRPAR